MNKVILMGRLTRDPEVRYSQGESSMAIAKYSLAVDRRGRSQEGDQTADFINITAFGRAGEFAEKYLHKGTKVLVTGRIQTGSYTNKDGVKVYTTDVIAEDQEFAESKNASSSNGGGYQEAAAPAPVAAGDGFMNVPEGIDEDLPFAQPGR
ncbi:MAG: single-stranded DNA-binding protein [Lachnospiraceae bacterium]|jgi:single-strand DNA-binding protein|nr:single-stranded DNA-binding protein [Lachnospiraceae bacterium]